MKESENGPMNVGTPSNLELLLHCYYSPEAHPRVSAPAIKEGISYLVREKMITPVYGKGPDIYTTTDKGEAFIKHLMTIPFPVIRWEFPSDAG